MEDESPDEKSYESRSRDVEQERRWESDDESRNDRREEVPFHVPRD